MTTYLPRFARFLVILIVLLVSGVFTTFAQDTTPVPGLPGLATATPQPGLPGIAPAIPTTEYPVASLVINIPAVWPVWSLTTEKPTFELIPYAVLATQSPNGVTIQVAVVPNDVVKNSPVKSSEASAIFAAYKAQQISKLVDQPIALTVISNQLWLLLPTATDLVIVTVDGDTAKERTEILGVIGTIYPKGKVPDTQISGHIDAYLVEHFAVVNPVVVEPATTPEVVVVDAKRFLPTTEEMQLGSTFTQNLQYSGTYTLDKVVATLSGIFGQSLGSALELAAKKAQFVSQETIVWTSTSCESVEIDVIQFATETGPVSYAHDDTVIAAWKSTNNYTNFVKTDNGLEGSGAANTDCGPGNSVTVQVGHKNYLIAVNVVTGSEVDAVKAFLYQVIDFIIKKIG